MYVFDDIVLSDLQNRDNYIQRILVSCLLHVIVLPRTTCG